MTALVRTTDSAEPVTPPWRPGHRDGLLDLGMRRDATGRTCVRRQHQRFPLRTTVPFYLDPHDRGMAFVYAQNPTGGVFEGDRLVTKVEVEPQARVHLTTQSATKIFSMTADYAKQDYCFQIGESAVLEHIPDMLIPHAHARLRQRISVELSPGAAYIGAEVIAPGRAARDERFAYQALQLITTVTHDGREIGTDVVRLVPTEFDPHGPGQLGEYDYLVTMTVAARGRSLDAAAFDTVAATAAGDQGVGGAGALPGGAGISVRLLTHDSRSAVAATRRCWEHARSVLLDSPLPRTRK